MRRTVLSEEQVVEIIHRLDQKDSQKEIALDFGVSTKTISRINTGKNWGWLKKQVLRPEEILASLSPIFNALPQEENYLNLLDEVTAVKNAFGLSFDLPINWGWFTGWDGFHAIATDGIIAWESVDLVNYAIKLSNLPHTDKPIFANVAKELPTLDLELLFSQPTDKQLFIQHEYNGSATLSPNNIQIDSKFVRLASKLKLQYFAAGKTKYVYLVKSKPKSNLNVIIACVAPLE